MNIVISSNGNLLSQSTELRPIRKTPYCSQYRFFNQDISFTFENFEKFQKKWVFRGSPGIWLSKSNLRWSNEEFSQAIEISRKINFKVTIPFKINWHSTNRRTVPLIKVKFQVANLTNIKNKQLIPYGNFRNKKRTENYKALITLKKLPAIGELCGSLNYTYQPESWYISRDWGYIDDIPQKIQQRYSQELPFWRQTSKLEEIVEQIPRNDALYEQIAVVYRFVTNFITAENLEIRKGIKQLLEEQSPVGDCDEFTDLQITIFRMLKIPARRIVGIVFNPHSKNTWHAWTEVFIPKIDRWIPIDAAMRNFGFLSTEQIPMKIEGTNSSRTTIEVIPYQSQPALHSKIEDPIIDVDYFNGRNH
ncbi:MAG: transglutaminase-like domain-containing protein [Candidatus Hodarchaeales archaeon]|jgi:hypothetical protein